MISKTFKLALCQIKQSKDKLINIESARKLLKESAKNGAKVCVLGETFNSLYQKEFLRENAENLSDKSSAVTVNFLQDIAKELNIYLIAGSIPEIDENKKLYNTSLVFDKNGELIAKHRKVHLFDIDIPGKATYKESDIFCAGNDVTVFDTEYCKMGLAICYDIRFPELALLMAKKGAKVLFYPANFTMTTGPLHWETLLKARALDCQVYVAGCSTSKYSEDPSIYQSWGHSTIVDPMSKVLSTCEHEETILYSDIDLQYLEDVRQQLPYQYQKRTDLYDIKDPKKNE